MKGNKGLSLVELLITMAILSIVMAIAVSFMMTGSRSFTKGNADSNVQKEAELTVNQIEDMIIDINGGVEFNTDDPAKPYLTMYHAEDDGSGAMLYTMEEVKWSQSDEKMSCSKWKVVYDAATDSWVKDAAATINYTDQLLAEHVTSFDVDLSDTVEVTKADGTKEDVVRSVLVKVGYDDGTGIVDYATSPVITLRNRLLLSANPANIFEEHTPMSDTLKLYYTGLEIGSIVPIVDRTSEVQRGSVYNVYARINTGADVNDLVDWKIEETGTLSTIDANGILTVGAYEANAYLTITASYKSNPNKKATGVVKVMGGISKSLKSVHIRTLSLQPFAPQYDAIPVTEGFRPEEEAAITYKWTVTVEQNGEGDNRELADVVAPFTDNSQALALTVKKEKDNFGRMLEIIVEAHSDVTGETRTDRVKYRIDKNGAVTGDSNLERGKTWTWFVIAGQEDSQGIGDLKDSQEYYFCDEYGNRISAYDHLLGCIQLNRASWMNYQFYFTDDLPRAQEYYVKVIFHYEGYDYNTGLRKKWSRERIHYIPAVQIYGKTCYNTTNVYSNFDFEYSLVGYGTHAWAQNQPPAYQYDLVDFVYEAPDGVVVAPRMDSIQTTVHGEHAPIYAWGSFECNAGEPLKKQVKLQSMTIRVSVKNEPSINALVTIIFE